MAKRLLASLALCLLLGFSILPAFAAGDAKSAPDATLPKDCVSQEVDKKWVTPPNCLFLEEPIGGKANKDLFYVHCGPESSGSSQAVVCKYLLWSGTQSQIKPGDRGPIQAVLTREANKAYQGPFGLLYSYISLVYNYMSGLIIGISVLFVVIGGIQISTSHGDEGVSQGKSRIIKAVTGIILWFTASLILYTINPTFFTFGTA